MLTWISHSRLLAASAVMVAAIVSHCRPSRCRRRPLASRRRRGPVRSPGHSRRHRHRRHRRAAARADRHRGQNNRITEVASVGFPGSADQRARPAGQGHQGDRRHRHVPDARASSTRTCTAAAGRPTIPNTSTSCGWRTASPRCAACRAAMDWDLSSASCRRRTRSSRRASSRITGRSAARAGIARGRRRPRRARVGALRRQEGHRRPEARRLRSRRSWRRCSTRRRSTTSDRPRTSIRWASSA